MDKHQIWQAKMTLAQLEWDSLLWRVAKSDSPHNASISRCKTLIGALYTALVYKMFGWQVFIYKHRPDGISSEEGVQIVKLMSKASARK